MRKAPELSLRCPWRPVNERTKLNRWQFLSPWCGAHVGELARFLAGRVKCRDDGVHNLVGVELLSGPIPHAAAIHRLGLFNGLHEDRERPHVIVRFRTLTTWRQPVHDDACFASPYEGSFGLHAHCRTASQQDLPQGQRPVVIVSQAGTRP